MTPWARLQAYVAHPDPATDMANVVAMVVGWNTPFYPLYVVAVAGTAVAAPAMLTVAACPFFLAVPAVSRRSSRLGRLALPVIGISNTLWCTKVLGPSCDLELFLLPCILLAALLHRPGERLWSLSAGLLAIVAYFVPAGMFGAPIIPLPPAGAHHLAAIDEGSVVCLCALLAWRFSKLFREQDAKACAAITLPGCGE